MIPIDDISESLIRGLQRHVEIDEPEEEKEDIEIGDDGADYRGQGMLGGYEVGGVADTLGMQIKDGEVADKSIFEDADETLLSEEG